MAFTEQDFKNQQQEIFRLAEELKRLNSNLDAQKKALGIEGEVTLDDIEMTPALERAMAEAKAEAERAGRASAARLQPVSTPSAASSRPRRGAMRI
ncbi:MAG: hypothetical protein IKY97_03685 [Mailhella sp.]|nr:hypothetical protein [Mailhella sp.]